MARSAFASQIVKRDGVLIGAALDRDLFAPFLREKFPGEPIMAHFELGHEEAPSVTETADLAGKLKVAGYLVDQSELEEQVGLKLVKDETQPALPGGFNALANKILNKEISPKSVEASEPQAKAVLKAFAEDMGPASEAVAKLLKNPTPETAAALLDELPALLPDDPALATVIAEAMAEEFGVMLENTEQIPAGHANAGQFTGKTNQPRGKEPETKPQHDRYGSTDEKTLVDEPQKNFKRGANALEAMERMQGGYIDRAMYREETGWIRFDWGDPGDPAKDYEHGHGISHILVKHGKDAKKLPEVISNGRAVKNPDEPDKTYIVTDSAYAVVIPLNQTQRRMLTMFEPKPNSKKLETIKNYPPTPKRQGR